MQHGGHFRHVVHCWACWAYLEKLGDQTLWDHYQVQNFWDQYHDFLENNFFRSLLRLFFKPKFSRLISRLFLRPNIFETDTDTLKKMKKSLETRCHTLLFWLGKLSKNPLTDNHIAYGIDQVRDMKKIMTNQCNEKLHCSASWSCNLRTLVEPFSLAALNKPGLQRYTNI